MSLNYTEQHKPRNSCMMSILNKKQQHEFNANFNKKEQIFFENICNESNKIDQIENKCLVLQLFQDCIKMKYNK